MLDTNALLLPFGSSLRIETEVDRLAGPVELVVPRAVVGELERLADRGLAGAEAALALARRFRVIPSPGRGDAAVRTAARDQGAWVLTADRALRDRLLQDGIPVLFPRNRGRLALRMARVRATVKSRPRVADRRRGGARA